jgi:hypothetical protein
MVKRKATKTRRVTVITPSGNRRTWSVPVAGFKGTVAVLAKYGFHVITRRGGTHA